MIKKLKLRFILLSMTALLVLLAVIVTGMNIISYSAVTSEADEVVKILSHNKGRFPEPRDKEQPPVPPHMSPEIPYESRYFWVLIDVDGNIIQTETSKIASVSTSDAIDFAKTIYSENNEKGFIKSYRYQVYKEQNGFRITFLDCSHDLRSFRSFVTASIVMSIVGYVIVFFVIFFFSGKILAPVAESYDKQKRFITDAGHEIKTPLTIISANADVLEMEFGENECISDIQEQTKRLAALTSDLVYLSRMEEEAEYIPTNEINMSEIILETIHSFNAPAKKRNVQLFCNVQPLLMVKGEQKAMRQLITVLIDNAIKYSPIGGIVSVDFRKDGKTHTLSIVNSTEHKLDQSELSLLFDRFYRPDLSRSSETGGHGVGLSIAKAIVTAHKGKIEALCPNDKTFHIAVALPSVNT